MEDTTKKQPPSYVDYMNDVFEATLPNEPHLDRKFHPDGSAYDRTKHDYYKNKWIEIATALGDNVIVRVNRVDFGLDWKTFAKLEPALESSGRVVRKLQLGDGTKVFSVNCNVSSFAAILDYFRNGQLHMPADVCPNVFKRELEYWRVDFREMSQCCLRKYANFHDDEQTLTNFEESFTTKPDAKFIDSKTMCPSRWNRIQASGWAILSDPTSSIWAKIYLGVASFLVVLSIFLLAASTHRAFQRELEPSEWEEFMSSEEIYSNYELIYKRPKPSSKSREGQSSGPDGPDGPKRKKRSMPDETYDAVLDREKQSEEKQNADFERKATGQLRSHRDTLVNPLDVDAISENYDVGGDENPHYETTGPKQGTNIRIDLQGLLESILTNVLEEISQRQAINRQNPPGDRYAPNRPMASEREDRKNNDHLDREAIEGMENPGETDLRIGRQSRDRVKAVDGNGIRRIHRFKRSPSGNDSQSSNSNGTHMLEGCVYLDAETLHEVLEDATEKAASIISTTTQQLPSAYNVYDWINHLEMVCIVFFAFEFFIRFLFAPSKIPHLLSFFTIIDFLALVTMLTTVLIHYLNPKEKYTTSVVDAINCFQVARVFRFFRLMKNVVGFRVLVFSIRSSWRELLLLVLYIVMAVTIFSTMIYFSEKDNMNSIPDACWWAIVTMTTVGYGDMAPKTLIGKLIGVACALSGVLLIAVTVPVFVNNFLLFYEHSKVIHYDPKKSKDGNSKTPLPSDSSSEVSETTFVEESVEREGKKTVSRESSQSEWNSGKPRLKSQISMSKVVPIMIKVKDGAPQGEKN